MPAAEPSVTVTLPTRQLTDAECFDVRTSQLMLFGILMAESEGGQEERR
jgi:hypothetical protein